MCVSCFNKAKIIPAIMILKSYFTFFIAKKKTLDKNYTTSDILIAGSFVGTEL